MNTVISAGVIAVLGLAALPEPARAQRSTESSRVRVTVPDLRLPQGFSVVLVLGDLQGGATQDNVPPAARKALTDMKDFLPYKGYRLLDVQWTLCCGAKTSPVVSRLRGPDGRDYELTLLASLESRPRLSVRFVLREPAGAEQEAGDSELVRELELERARLETEYQTLRRAAERRHEVGTGKPPDEDPDVRQARLRAANARIKVVEASHRKLGGRGSSFHQHAMIDTSFTMDVGETVVVGTSRLAGGDKALIALLTAVPRNTAAK